MISNDRYQYVDGAPTLDRVQELLGCDRETAIEVLDLCEAGYAWGREGFWPDGEFGSDADWTNGPGNRILELECFLDLDDGAVFDLFRTAHEAGLAGQTSESEE